MDFYQIVHERLRDWIWESAALCQPRKIVIVDGSEEQRKELLRMALATGELIELNQEKMPSCYYHRSAPGDEARTEKLTYICTPDENRAGPTNNWMSPQKARDRAGKIFHHSMHNRTMYVIPFSMGPIGSKFSKIGVELTDSLYVVLNMMIMTRVGSKVLKALSYNGKFTKCLHGLADRDPLKRLILHFPQDNEIQSVGSGYGGNALLGKKCMALRLGSCQAQEEGWLAEHMLIMGIEQEDEKRIVYVAAAFPSACGKTNLSMMIPPEGLKAKRIRIFTVGDDISWMRPDTDGQLWGINPEAGVFGVAPGTNSLTNPNMIATISRNTIFTNVLQDDEGGVWWEGGDGPVPNHGVNWQGFPWKPGAKVNGQKILAAHANSRFTAPIDQCPSVSMRRDQPQGVPISAFLFGGRREKLAPLVYQAFDWPHGVYVGATMSSEVTAAQSDSDVAVRYDPMAMRPFCGYPMADYLGHWLGMEKRLNPAPKIFHVNWFRKDEKGKFLWPGFGDNLRVLEWVVKRCLGKIGARETPIGYMPGPKDLDLKGLNISPATMKKLLAIDKKLWLKEMKLREEFMRETIGNTMPVEIFRQHERVLKNLRKL